MTEAQAFFTDRDRQVPTASYGSDFNTPDTGPALSEFFKEVRRLQSDPPPDAELALIRGYRGGVFVLANASRGGIIGTLAMMDFHDLPDTYLTDYVSEVFALTPEQISATVSKYLRPDDMTLVVVGDRGQVSEQVDQWMGSGDD